MGYYTHYDVQIQRGGTYLIDPDTHEHILSRLSDISNYQIGDGYMYAKWYDYHKDMLRLSTEYPEYLFEVTGSGEESGDYWRAWYQNGKTYSVKAELPEYDPTKMT